MIRRYQLTTHWPERKWMVMPSKAELEKDPKAAPKEQVSAPRDTVDILSAGELCDYLNQFSGRTTRATFTVETIEPQEEQEWYVAQRDRVEAFVDAQGLEKEPFLEEFSPTRRYRLRAYHTKPRQNAWQYTQATVELVDDPIHHEHVIRNYPNFHHGWVEGYQGHDYLLCGEDYQGVTVIELDTWRMVNYIHPFARRGNAFCFAEYTLLPDNKLEVLGCYWASPYERVTFDFSRPMELPWPELSRRAAFETDEEDIEQELRNG